MFREYFVGKPYPRDTHKNSRLSWFFTFQSCALHVVISRVSFLRNPLDLQYKLESLHSLSHTTFTIKIPHKYKGKNDWMKLQSNLARNKSQHKIVINNNFTDYLASISGPISSDMSLKGSPHNCTQNGEWVKAILFSAIGVVREDCCRSSMNHFFQPTPQLTIRAKFKLQDVISNFHNP